MAPKRKGNAGSHGTQSPGTQSDPPLKRSRRKAPPKEAPQQVSPPKVDPPKYYGASKSAIADEENLNTKALQKGKQRKRDPRENSHNKSAADALQEPPMEDSDDSFTVVHQVRTIIPLLCALQHGILLLF